VSKDHRGDLDFVLLDNVEVFPLLKLPQNFVDKNGL
jgi:hypothetical protein